MFDIQILFSATTMIFRFVNAMPPRLILRHLGTARRRVPTHATQHPESNAEQP